jgi:release factor glutamine methyltransferase
MSEQAPPWVVTRLRAAGCVFAEDEALLLDQSGASPDELLTMVERRAAGEPLEQVLGWAQFCGLRIVVRPGVFVPRRRSEWLVHEAATVTRPGSTVLDLCCGSGAVGAALIAMRGAPQIELHAADIDPAAVACARANLEPLGATTHCGDLYAALPATLRGGFDVIVVNAPYVPTGELRLLPPEARLHESRVALDGGADGLGVQRRAIAGAPDWLAPDGHLLVETSRHQSSATADLFSRSGLAPRVSRSPELDATVVEGTNVP